MILIIASQNVPGQVRQPLTEKENPVSSDKMPDYLWQKVKKDPFTKEHYKQISRYNGRYEKTIHERLIGLCKWQLLTGSSSGSWFGKQLETI